MKKFYMLLLSCFCFLYGSYAQTLINPIAGGGFDLGNTFTANGWNVVNSSANKWVVGTTTFKSSPNSAYISKDSMVNLGPLDYDYDYDNTTPHISHIYQQVTIPANASSVSLSFQLKGNLEKSGSLLDGLKVYADPSLTVPVADALPTWAIPLFTQSVQNANYVGSSYDISSLAGQTIFIIFTWMNDGDGIGSGPPASVDNLSLTYCIFSGTFNVTGGGGYCVGSAGVSVGLDGSTEGASYQLYNNGSPVGSPVVGTGNALDFGLQNAVGTYTVKGITVGNCSPPTIAMTGQAVVTQNPLPVPVASSNAPLCSGSTLNLMVNVGTTFSWTGPNSFISASQTPSINNVSAVNAGTYTVTVTDNNGCSGQATANVTLTPNNTVTPASASPVICINSALTNITHTTTGATGISNNGVSGANGLPAGVSATWSSNTITISGTPSASGTFNYSIPLTGGCGNVNATGIITVTQGYTVSVASSTPTLCINTALTAITHTTTGATGISNNGVSGANGLPAGVSATWSSNTITISGTPTAPGTFNYSISLTGGCGSVSATGMIIVTPGYTVSAASSTPTLCINTALTAITHATTGATGISNNGVSGANGLPAGVSATWSSNTITISGTPTASGTFNYSIPLTGGCGSVSAMGIIIVTPGYTVSAASSTPALCINTALTAITHTTTGATGISNNGVSGANGLPVGVSATWSSNTITISGTPTASGTFNYTIPLTGGCGTTNATGTITVNPANTVSAASSTPMLCINTALTAITHTTIGATGISNDGVSGANGLPAGVSATWVSNTITINGTPTASGTFNYSIPLAGGCGSVNATGTINVTPLPGIVLTSGSNTQSVCDGTPITPITYTYNNLTGLSVNGLPSGLTVTPGIGTLSITGTPSATGTYTITVNGTCGQATASGTITVQPAQGGSIPSVSICSGESGTLTLSGETGSILGWEYSTGGSWNPTAVTPNTTHSQDYTNIIVPTKYRAIVSNGCGTVYSTVALVSIHNYWVGGDITKPTDWNTPANWSDGMLPSMTPCPDVYIPNTSNQPVLNNAPVATIGSLYIFAGATLTVNGTGLLQIGGTISNLGTLDVTAGSLEFNGSDQSISGSILKDKTVKNLIVSSGGTGLSVSNVAGDTLNILGTLSFGNSTADVITGDNITLKSLATATANVGVLASGNVITGNVTVERYIATGLGSAPNHGKSWQLLAIPTAGPNPGVDGQTIKAAWQEGATASNFNYTGSPHNALIDPHPGYGTMVTSDVANAGTQPDPGFDVYTSPGPSIKAYNAVANNFIGPASSQLPLYNQKGYYVFVRGDRSVGTSSAAATPTILRTTGQLFTPAKPPPVTTIAADLFESIGNPYASAIDMRKITKDANVQDLVYVWDPRLGGTYNYGAYQTFYKAGSDYFPTVLSGSYYTDDGTGNPLPFDSIQSGQAFLMHATTSGTGTVSFTESAKSGGSFLFTTPNPVQQVQSLLRVNINAFNANGGTSLLDGVLVSFDDAYSNAVDALDAQKSINTGENLGIKTGGKILVIERMKPLTAQDTIFLNLTGVRAQQYQFHFDARNINPGLQAFLADHYTNTRTLVSLAGTTDISFTIQNIAGSNAANRFMIVFEPLKALPVTFTSIKAYRQDKNINVEWRVDNEVNMKQYEVEKSTDGNNFTGITQQKPTANNGGSAVYVSTDASPVTGFNYYRVKSTDINGKTSYTNVVKVIVGTIKQDITIYPNPITDGMIHLQFLNEPAGKYKIRLLNKLGQVILQQQVTRADGNGTEYIKWDYNLAHGMYQLEVTKPDGTGKDINVLY